MTDGDRTLVVVGASLAGLRAVEAARRLGHTGPLVLVGGEEHLPYDRPPLSKDVLLAGLDADADADADDESPPPPPPATTHRGADRLAEDHGVEVRLTTWATGLDVEGRVLTTDRGDVGYDALVVATGSTARTLPGVGGIAGVHLLRTVEDARAIRAAMLAGARTVVVGAGLIGSEVASAARARGLVTTVVEAAPVPLVRAVGRDVGSLLADLHHRAGTDLRLGTGVAEVLSEVRDGVAAVCGVRLDDGSEVPCDLVVVGVGATPATGWLEGSGLDLTDGVTCDETLRAVGDGVDGVWAAGDVARWPNAAAGGRTMRLETWTSASEQGLHAARNAVAPHDARPYATVPYFWSEWYGHRLQHVGVPDADEVEVLRSARDDGLIALYRTAGAFVGAFLLDRPGLTHKLRRALTAGGSYDDARALALARL